MKFFTEPEAAGILRLDLEPVAQTKALPPAGRIVITFAPPPTIGSLAMIPAAHRAHYLSVTAGLLLNETRELRGETGARIVALAEQINETAAALRDELTGRDETVGNTPTETTAAAVYGGNVVPLPLPVRRLRG